MDPANRLGTVSTFLMFPERRALARAELRRLRRNRRPPKFAALSMFPLLAIAATVCAGDATGAGTNKGSPETRAFTSARLSPDTLGELSLVDQLMPLPADLEIRTVVVTAGTSGALVV